MAVEPPTEPAVCTRSSGLPAAPSASARNSSGIITPSNRSGALPTTIASISSSVMPASSRARSMASRHRPAIETSSRLARWWVWPMPMTAAGCLAMSGALPVGVEDAHEVLLQGRARRRVAERACEASPDQICLAASPIRMPPPENIGLPASGAAGRVDRDVVGQPELAAQDQLLVAERRVQLGDLDAVEVGARPRRAAADGDRVRSRVPMLIGSM